MTTHNPNHISKTVLSTVNLGPTKLALMQNPSADAKVHAVDAIVGWEYTWGGRTDRGGRLDLTPENSISA